MKKTITFISALLCLVLFNSCNNSDNDSPQPQSVEGVWRLNNVHGGVAGTNDDFPGDTVTWTFNANGTVTVYNYNTDTGKIDFMDTGIYNYGFAPNTVNPAGCSSTLVIDGVNYGCHSISGNVLTLSQLENDGYEVTLTKIEFTTNTP